MESPSHARLRLSPRPRERGQMLVMFLIFLIPLTLAGLSVYNVGMIASEKAKLQNAADNAAYSAAVWEARYLNLAAYTTRTMVANYDTIALVTGFWSFTDAIDGFLAEVQEFLGLACLIPIIDFVACPAEAAVEAIHVGAVHPFNFGVATAVGIISPLLEAYNQALSGIEQALYLTTQAARPKLIQKIANGVDSGYQYWPGAEVFNFQELADRRDWTGTDKDKGLRLTIERSLNRFSNGESFRDFANLIPGAKQFLQTAIDVAALGCGHVNLGPEGFDGPGFDHVTGEVDPGSGDFATGGERTLPNGNSQIIVRGGDSANLKDTIYQLDHSGIDVEIGGCDFLGVGIPKIFGFTAGHFSDDEFNTGANVNHVWDSIIPATSPIPNDSPAPVAFDTFHPQGVSDTDGVDRTEDPADPIKKFIGDPGCPTALAGFIDFAIDCRTESKLRTKLKDVNVTLYKDDGEAGDNAKRLEGPRVFVYLQKPSKRLPLFTGFGLTEGMDTNLPPPSTEITGFTPAMEAYGFGRVYFSQRVGADTNDAKLKETGFNPFWAARLERLSDGNGNELLH